MVDVYERGAHAWIRVRKGVALAGADSSELEVVWEKPRTAGTPVYGATPVFLKDGVEVLGTEMTAVVTMEPIGKVLILR